MSGGIADAAGMEAAFLVLAAIGVIGVLTVWLAMPETRDATGTA
jgi:predicted MFS family arabinose efflux permease